MSDMYNIVKLIDGVWIKVAGYSDIASATKALIIAQLESPNVCLVPA
jgi:hypothetical protein